MANLDAYGTQQPIASFKLLIDRGGMYNRGGDLMWQTVHKVWCISAMAPSGGESAALDRRFTSLFSIYHAVSPSDESLQHNFNTILGNYTRNFFDEVQKVFKTITDCKISLYTDIVARMPSTPFKFHYVFNLRDISRVFERLGSFVRFWQSECLRVCHDHLTNLDNRNWVMNELEILIEINFSTVREDGVRNPSIYGDFIAESGSDTYRCNI
jgi:dynein heavy chain